MKIGSKNLKARAGLVVLAFILGGCIKQVEAAAAGEKTGRELIVTRSAGFLRKVYDPELNIVCYDNHEGIFCIKL